MLPNFVHGLSVPIRPNCDRRNYSPRSITGFNSVAPGLFGQVRLGLS